MQGKAAAEKAAAIGGKTERERACIAAIGQFYGDFEQRDHKSRTADYEKAMELVYHSYPDDREAAALYALALQATALGYHAHGMAGVEWDAAREALKVPERFRFEAGCVLGRIAPADTLDEKLRAREVPSGRKPIAEFAFAGSFPAA